MTSYLANHSSPVFSIFLKRKHLLLFFFLMIAGFFHSIDSFAQQSATDSLRKEMEAARAARTKTLDSMRQVRAYQLDSIKKVRQRVSDSLAAIRAYKESKRYKDSVEAVRKARTDSIRAVRTAYFDSIKAERKRINDSATAARKKIMDSVTAVRKARSDSLRIIREYRESKRYKDSVEFTRQQRLDSIRQVRKQFNDSVMAERVRMRDSAVAVRKKINDSLKQERQKITDSLTAIRKQRSDSLTKIREEKEKLRKVQEKKREEKQQLALELKIKKKREAWNNEKMLKRKWTFTRKTYHNTVTKYNYYFNANRKMDEAIDNMLRMRQERYDSLISLFPFDPDMDSTMLSADMDSIIQKASLGIQIHDPRTMWADDLYLLLGQAYYYKGNYEQASTAFKYIISMNQQRKKEELKKAAGNRKNIDKTISVVEKEEKKPLDFLRHKSSNNEAILWLARTYTESGKASETMSILDLLESDKNMTEELKGRVALEKAYLYLEKKDYKAVPEHLKIVYEDKSLPDWVRIRAAYLNGQLLYDQKNYPEAIIAFQQAINMNPAIELDFYARKNIAYAYMNGGGKQEEAVSMLETMLKDGKYTPYHEQVYYVLGRLSHENEDMDKAVTWLQKSVSGAKTTKRQKAISFAALGNTYYSMSQFRQAKIAYDSAAFYSRHAAEDPTVELAVKRAQTVDKIVDPQGVITASDSLLVLATKSEKEQRNIARQYIKMLEKRIADSIQHAQLLEAEGAMPTSDPGAGSSALGSFTNWYFSNSSLMKQGYNDFKKKWGNRPDVDDWRRSKAGGKGSRSGGDTSSDGSSESADENGLPTEETLLAYIPKTQADADSLHAKIQKAYIDLATAYVNDVEDYTRAEETLNTFENRYTTHPYTPEVLFIRYQAALGLNKLDEAQKLSTKLRTNYPQSPWAEKVAPVSEKQTTGLATVSVANYYDETYGLMMQRNFHAVLERARKGRQVYNDPVYNNRFQIMEAIALTGVGSFKQAESLLTQFVNAKGTDSLRVWAETILDYIRKNQPQVTDTLATQVVTSGLDSTLNTMPGASTSAPSIASLDTSQTSLPVDTSNSLSKNLPMVPVSYTFTPAATHYFVFYFKKAESRAMGVRAALKDFNTFKFSSQKLTTKFEMLKEDQGIITVQAFPSSSHARIYLNAVRINKTILKEYKPEEYTLFIISEENYVKLITDKDVEPYLKFYQSRYR